MAQWLYEHKSGRKIGKDRSTIRVIATGFNDEYAAESEILQSTLTNPLLNGHVFDDWKLTKRFRSGAFEFQLNYVSSEEKQKKEPTELAQGEWSFSFDTTGGSERVTQALATKAFDSTGRASAKDGTFNNAIKVVGSGQDITAEGVQIVVPKLRFQIRARLPNSLIATSYAKLMSELTARTNDSMFPPASMPFVDDQWDTDEVLFLGNTGSWASSGDIELTFHFDAGTEVQGLETGDIIGIIKLPHEFVWYRYKKETDSSRLVVTPEIAFVEKVYESDDLEQIFTG